jgi:hypothetical protein
MSYRILKTNPRPTKRLNRNPKTFVIKVYVRFAGEGGGDTSHKDFESSVFFANEILDGDFDVFKGKVGGH